MNEAELTGRARSHIRDLAGGAGALHLDVSMPFLRMRDAASRAGIDLVVYSGFRDFDRQLHIWNGKFSGARPMLDAHGTPIQVSSLEPRERIDAILLWSALPGASRHHWGTDLDLIDRNALPEGYRAQLTGEEYAPGGIFSDLAQWLADHAARFGFFRPFRGVRSGVQPEPWHLSFAPVAEGARRKLGPGVLRAALESAPLEGKEFVLARLEELHQRYIHRIDAPG